MSGNTMLDIKYYTFTDNVKLSVKEAVRKLEGEQFGQSSSSSGQRKPRFVKPRMGKGVKRDGLIQAFKHGLIVCHHQGGSN